MSNAKRRHRRRYRNRKMESKSLVCLQASIQRNERLIGIILAQGRGRYRAS